MKLNIKMYRFLIILSFLVFIPFVKAETISSSCTTNDKLLLRELASKIKFNYQLSEYKSEEGEIFKAYKLAISNFSNKLYIETIDDGIYIKYEGDPTYFDGLTPGHTYNFGFYGSANSNCADYKIMNQSIYFPPYNKYSEDPLCIGHEEYELCKKISPIDISYTEFVKRMKAYISSLKQTNNNNVISNNTSTKEKTNLINKILDFLVDNILYITIPIIIGGTAAIVIIEVKKRRSIL